MMIRIGLVAIMAAVIVYGIFETKQWSRAPELISGKQRRIRALGFFFLLLSLSLGLYGTYMHTPHTHGHHITRAMRLAALDWIGYWTVTVLCLVPIIPLALLDARENLRRASEQRRSILQEALSNSEAAGGERPASET